MGPAGTAAPAATLTWTPAPPAWPAAAGTNGRRHEQHAARCPCPLPLNLGVRATLFPVLACTNRRPSVSPSMLHAFHMNPLAQYCMPSHAHTLTHTHTLLARTLPPSSLPLSQPVSFHPCFLRHLSGGDLPNPTVRPCVFLAAVQHACALRRKQSPPHDLSTFPCRILPAT